MRVLILEDDPNLLMAFEDALEEDGYVVIACLSEDAAMEQLRLQGSTVDVIVLDLCIGSGSSLSVADFAGYASPNAEVIIVTGSGLYPHGELLKLSRNVSWALRKPVRMSDLQAMVHFAGHKKQKHPAPIDEIAGNTL